MRRRELPGGVAPPTKSELKRQAQAVQALADRLVEAPAESVAGLDLPDKLADAIALARRIAGGGALVRQRQFVAKLMRGLDLEPIRTALDAGARDTRLGAARFKRAERWRERLLDGGAAEAEAFAAKFAADRRELEPLVRAAVAERRTGKPAGAARALFRRVTELLDASS